MVPHVYLDGIMLDFEDKGNGSTIGELIEAVENDLTGARRFVMELWVDGERLPEWRGSTVLKRPLAVYNDFKLKTASMEEVALEGLDLLQEYIRVTRENIPLCVSDLRIGGSRSDASFSAIFDGLVEIVKTMDALARGGEKYNMDLFKENPAIFYNAILRCLEGMRQAREGGDTVTLADLLEYEVLPFAEEMEERLFHFNA